MVLSSDLISAARDGNLAAVQEFLAAGGDPDERIGPDLADAGRTLLHVVAGARFQETPEESEGRIAIARALLEAGSAVDAKVEAPDRATNTPLVVACIYERSEIVQLLCQAGADVNYIRSCSRDESDDDIQNPPDFPLSFAIKCPAIIRTLLDFGADPSVKCEEDPTVWKADPKAVLPEEEALRLAHIHRHSPAYAGDYIESARLLSNARLLRPRLRGVFSLRALCHRGRATPTSETPDGFALLVYAPACHRRKTRAAWRRAPQGLPDPLAHLVCKFWLGEPIRRAAPASE